MAEMLSPQKAFIDSIRRDRFSIGAETPNPLAGSLHEAIRHLSAELYQKDIHFISELIQNAEDNSYKEGVEPELDLVLTRTDVTGVGASATLIFFNNEMGFKESNISALCSVGQSTKKGQRNEGYIGQKGIGFKSVFVVTSTPYIISNGFRIRLSDTGEDSAGSAAGIGYIVPKWVERPTDEELRSFWRPDAGSESERNLPSTIIVLPLGPEKVASVEAELKQISPETILFLRRITRLRIREDSRGKFYHEVIISRSDSPRASHGDDAAGFMAKLSVVKEPGHIIEARDYFLWQQRFNVTVSVEQRREVTTWAITLAFPQQDRIAGGSHGNIYAFLPSQLNSGLPFLINADFLLVSSQETLKFDSPWNQGILSCVPTAFCEAMGFLQGKSDSARASSTRCSAPLVYKFFPVKDCLFHFKSVRNKILSNFEGQDCILVAANVGSRIEDLCKPSVSRRVDERFRRILEAAFNEQSASPTIGSSNWFLVDRSVQENYSEVLDQLRVPWMKRSEYLHILEDSNWLLTLTDDLYLQVLAFVSALPSVRAPTEMWVDLRPHIHSLKTVKYEDSGTVRLISIDEIKKSKMAMNISPPQQGSHLSNWMDRFDPWIRYRFMPQQTVVSMKRAGIHHDGVNWLRSSVSVREVDVVTFASELVRRCTVDQNSEKPVIATDFLLLVWRFVYTSIQEGKLREIRPETWNRDFAVVDESGHVRWVKTKGNSQSTEPLVPVLLSRSCSKWPLLLTHKKWSEHPELIIRLSDDYLNLYDNSQRGAYERESCRVFLQDTFGATDLPDLPLPNISFPELKSLSSEQSRLLLQWLNRLRECMPDAAVPCGFWDSLETTAWLHTEQHGLQCPKMSFIPNDELKRFFQPAEVPFIDESFYGDVIPYSAILHKLGTVHSPKVGCNALAKQIQKLRNEADTSKSKKQMIKFYTYLQIYQWKPTPSDLPSVEIYIPSETGRQASWRNPQDCVIEDSENLFREVVPILCDVYPESLLSFFHKVLGVPRKVASAKYLDLWIYWRENLMQYDSEQCARLWEKIAVNWEHCRYNVREKFKVKAAVLTGTDSGEVQFTSPDSAFIPDDLQLRSVFMTHSSKLPFVWYPKGSSKIEAKLNEIYAYLGAKKLSDSVEVKRYNSVNRLSSCSTTTTTKFITPGLLVAILGFISDTEFAFSSERRQSIIAPLCGSVEKEISDACRILYKISSSSAGVRTAERHLLGFWDGKGVVYRIGDTHELLRDATNVRELETQVLESICSKILPDSPTIATSLVDFLKSLVGCRFDEAAVEYELRRKNLKLYSEDLEFLENVTNSLLIPDVNLRVFSSLQLL